MVGQRFITLLADHPWFEIHALAASARSAGMTYEEAVGSRWAMKTPIPEKVAKMVVMDASDVKNVSDLCDFVFCAVNMKKDEIKALEEAYAKTETPVISNNSANRGMADVPMLIPEINPEHAHAIERQRERLGTKVGFIAVKPNCSIQSYVPALTPLYSCGIESVMVSTYQAISGAGKTFETMAGNHRQRHSLHLRRRGKERAGTAENLGQAWKTVVIVNAGLSQDFRTLCPRAGLRRTPGNGLCQVQEQAHQRADAGCLGNLQGSSRRSWNFLPRPSSSCSTLTEEDRPQTKLDRDVRARHAVSASAVCATIPSLITSFVCISHNTLRGAAGGGVESAELLCAQGWIPYKK